MAKEVVYSANAPEPPHIHGGLPLQSPVLPAQYAVLGILAVRCGSERTGAPLRGDQVAAEVDLFPVVLATRLRALHPGHDRASSEERGMGVKT